MARTAGAIGGFVMALVTIFKKTWAPVTAPIYAVCEGLVLGAVSAIFEARIPGIVFQAVVADLRHPGGAAHRLQERRHQGHRELQARRRRGDRRHRARLPRCPSCSASSGSPSPSSTRRGGSESASACSSWSSRRSTWCSTSTSSSRARRTGRRSTWSGTGPSACMVTLVWLYLEILRLLAKLQSRRS